MIETTLKFLKRHKSQLFAFKIVVKHATKHVCIIDYSPFNNSIANSVHNTMFMYRVALGVNRNNKFFKAHNKN